MKKTLNNICVLCLTAACGLTLAALPASALADSMSSYNGQANDAQAKREAKERATYLSDANEHSLAYLGQARQFREQGRYELARQRYLQALSICADDQTLYVIKRELNGIELLLRTMR